MNTMDMKNFIEMGSTKAGSNKALAKILGQSEVALCEAKVGKRGLNDAVCIKLADFINANRIEVIAASNLVTEKDEERRKIYESCFKNNVVEILHKKTYKQVEKPTIYYEQLVLHIKSILSTWLIREKMFSY